MEGVLFTPEQLKAWKDAHGHHAIRVVEITDAEGIVLPFVVRVPNRRDISAFSNIVAKDLDKGLEFLIKNCTLDGPLEAALQEYNANLFFALGKEIQALIEIKQVEVKKL